ncbi:MAG: transposase [Trueperaceae bacterium]
MKRFRDYSPEQPYLLPVSPQEWLPDGHLAYFVHEVVGRLDLSRVFDSYREERGRPPFDPRMMVAVWIYAYSVGVRSSRRVERALVEDIAFRFLSGNQQAFAELFVQLVRLATGAGLMTLGHVAGSKLRASASKSKAVSYARMQAEERRLREEIEAYLRSCDEVDAREDEEFGPDDDSMSPPPQLMWAPDRLAAIKRAKEQLEREAVERAELEQQARRQRAAREDRAPP